MPSTPRRYPHPASASTTTVMRANRRTGTKPEVLVRSLLHRRGHRFRKDLTIRLPSTWTRPDIVFTRRRVAIYIDGCFWHGCRWHGTRPEHNAWYWGPKIARNKARDRAIARALRRQGWTVRRFWEHQAPELVVERIEALLRS